MRLITSSRIHHLEPRSPSKTSTFCVLSIWATRGKRPATLGLKESPIAKYPQRFCSSRDVSGFFDLEPESCPSSYQTEFSGTQGSKWNSFDGGCCDTPNYWRVLTCQRRLSFPRCLSRRVVFFSGVVLMTNCVS